LCLRLITNTSITSIGTSIYIPIHFELFTRIDDRDMRSIAFNLALDISLPSRYQILTPPFSEHPICRISCHPPAHSLSLQLLTLPPLTPSPQYNIHSTIHSTSQPITKPKISFLLPEKKERKQKLKIRPPSNSNQISHDQAFHTSQD